MNSGVSQDSLSLSPSKRAADAFVAPTAESAPTAETELLRFQRSSIHDLGGFARTTIPAGTRLIEYVGQKIDKAESLRRCEQNNPYIFTLSDESDLDGDVAWNPARFLNHSCAPNCDAELEDGRIWIVAKRQIPPGEEITFNYGFDLEAYRDYPCTCGSTDCVGFMVAEEFFEHVRQQRVLSAPAIPP